jgi:uncharacterized protein (DUF1499 family)
MIFSGRKPSNLGVKDGHLAPCPASPNCVCSHASLSSKAYIAPLAMKNDVVQETFQRLKILLSEMKGMSIITDEERYIHAERKTAIMGFVDDMEFYLNIPDHCIDVRSASRLGYSDLGVNRKVIESIRQQLNLV